MDSDDGVKKWTGLIVSGKEVQKGNCTAYVPSTKWGFVSLTDVLPHLKQLKL